MKKPAFAALLASAALAASCGQPADPTATAATDGPALAPSGIAAPAKPVAAAAGADLPARLDCLRENKSGLAIAHRGGPNRDHPENAVETLQRSYDAGARVMEIDIAQTRDGVLVLMHDDDLERTTTGEGLVADNDWAQLKDLNLETYQTETSFHPPQLSAALDWAVAHNALLELDRKRSTDIDKVIAAVRAAKAENNVFLITYTDEQAIEVHAKAPELTITATVDSIEQLDRLLAAGVKADRLVAWTGIDEPRPELWQALAARGVESIFGVQNTRNTKRDTEFWADDDGSEYNDLIASGLAFLVTGYSDKVTRQLAPLAASAEACGF
jgi:glycerophosphoryl diester phosphodiesterase